MDASRTADIREAIMLRFRLTLEDVFEISSVDLNLLGETLVRDGFSKKKADEEIKRCLEPFMVQGAPSVRWTPKLAAAQEL